MFSVDFEYITLQTRSIAQKRMPPAATQQTSDKESDEEEVLVSGRPSIGLARGRAMQPRPAMVIV